MSVSAIRISGIPHACVNNLRVINGAKEILALEHKLKPGDPVEAAMLAPYFTSGTFPKCPGGGDYTIGPIGTFPVCSVPGHSEAEIIKAAEQQTRRERIFLGCLIAGVVLVITWTTLSIRAKRKRALEDVSSREKSGS